MGITICGLSLLFTTLPIQQLTPTKITLSQQEFQRQLELAGTNPEKLLRLYPLAPESELNTLLEKTQVSLKISSEQLPKQELLNLEQSVSRLLPQCLSTQKDILLLLNTPDSKHRQILYKEYREQWIYQRPLALVLTFSCVRGVAPKLIDVHPIR